MKKLNNKGFILAETLIVSIFLLLLFTMIYSNYFPIIGEYEKREFYDDIDGKYAAYWIKKMIESDQYILRTDYEYNEPELIESAERRINLFNNYGYIRFECKDMLELDGQRDVCKALVNSFEVSNCDSEGNQCDIFITHYQIGANAGRNINPNFKETVKRNTMIRYKEFCSLNESDEECKQRYFSDCCSRKGLNSCDQVDAATVFGSYSSPRTKENDDIARFCRGLTKSRIFSSQVKDYILSLPNYTYKHYSTNSNYRVIVVIHHQKDFNDFYSFSTMEVTK